MPLSYEETRLEILDSLYIHLIQNANNDQILRSSLDYLISQHTTKKRKSLLKQWHNNNFSHEPPLCQTLTDSVKY